MVRTRIKAFRRLVKLTVVVFLLMGPAEAALAGCIGCESCQSISKIGRCTFYATEEATTCAGDKITHGGCGAVCVAAWHGCCACMQNQAACNQAKKLEYMSRDECAKAIAIWALSHSPK